MENGSIYGGQLHSSATRITFFSSSIISPSIVPLGNTYVYRPHASNDAHGGAGTRTLSPRNRRPARRSANGICAHRPAR